MEINIIKSLLFLILLIFVNETYKNILKIKEIGSKHIESFSCETERLKNYNPFLVNIEDDNSTQHIAYKPYHPNISHYGNKLYTIEEGQLRNIQETKNIENIKDYLNNNNNFNELDQSIYQYGGVNQSDELTATDKKLYGENYDKKINYKILTRKGKIENELKLHDWRNYIFENKKTDGTDRLENDIRTDYNPNIIGFQRRWEEYGTRNKIHNYYKDPELYQKQYENYYN